MTIISRRSLSDEEDHDEKADTLVAMYISLFVPAQVLGSFVLVLQEAYVRDGHFTFFSRMYGAIENIAVMSIAGGVAGAIFFGILVGEGVVDASADAVLLTVVLLSNTAGLIIIMLLLGYGLVSFPQMLWHKGNLKRQLNIAQQKAASRFKDLGETSLSMSMAVADVMKTKQELSSPSYNNQPQLAHAMEILIKECPTEFTSSTMGKPAVDKKTGKITINSLAALRSRVFTLKNSFHMSQGKVEEAKKNAYYYEDIIEAMGKSKSGGTETIKWSFAPESSTAGYKWHVFYKPLMYRVLAIVSAVLSVFSYLGIIGTMSGVGQSVSVYSKAVHADDTSGGGIVVFVLFTLGYAAFVIVWSVFQMKIANMMELLPAQRTTANSLSVNSRACIRLSAPLAFFYLGWIFENGVRQGSWMNGAEGGEAGDGDDNRILTAFTKFYQIDVIPVMGGSFNTLFPIIVFSVSGLVVLNLFNIVLVKMKLEKFQFGAEILTDEQLREGTRQLTRHKRTMERAYQRKALRGKIDGATTTFSPVTSVLGKIGLSQRTDEEEAVARSLNDGGDEEAGKVPVSSEPPELATWAAKKGNKKFGVAGGGWQNRYMIVRKPGILFYYKDENTSQEPSGQVDLRLVMSFTVKDTSDDKKLTEAGRLDLDLADRVLKLRFKTVDDANKWRDGLAQWKDYAIDYGTFFPSVGVVDGDTGEAEEEPNYVGSRTSAQLNDINVEEHETEETVGLTSKSKMSPFSYSRSSNDNTPAAAPSYTPAATEGHTSIGMDTLTDKPALLQGWMEKKQNKMGVAQWQRRYFRVDESSGCLLYFKSEKTTETPSGSIDLKLIVDVGAAEKDTKTDAARFNINMGDRVYKLRAPSTADGDRWIEGLNAWREYVLLNF